MGNVIKIYKKVGQTPLQALNEYRKRNPKYKDKKMAYAGRLDPMAEGLLLILVGDECKKRSFYQNMDKDYIAEIVLGVETDSYDLLGMLTGGLFFDKGKKTSQELLVKDLHFEKEEIQKQLNNFTGKKRQKYPPFSSQRVKGKPLFWWARRDKIHEIEIPEKEIEIYEISLNDVCFVSKNDLKTEIFERIKKVKGSFRQKKISELWLRFFSSLKIDKLQLINISVSCSSGTYIRSLAYRLGEKLGCGATSFSIKRTRIGKYRLIDK